MFLAVQFKVTYNSFQRFPSLHFDGSILYLSLGSTIKSSQKCLQIFHGKHVVVILFLYNT